MSAAETDFIKHVCGSCGGEQRLIMNGYDVLELIIRKEKIIEELEREIGSLKSSLAKKKPK